MKRLGDEKRLLLLTAEDKSKRKFVSMPFLRLKSVLLGTDGICHAVAGTTSVLRVSDDFASAAAIV
jgi:hypothetical protein